MAGWRKKAGSPSSGGEGTHRAVAQSALISPSANLTVRLLGCPLTLKSLSMTESTSRPVPAIFADVSSLSKMFQESRSRCWAVLGCFPFVLRLACPHRRANLHGLHPRRLTLRELVRGVRRSSWPHALTMTSRQPSASVSSLRYGNVVTNLRGSSKPVSFCP